MYVFTISNRYRVKRTYHTKPTATDCLLPCGPALWESPTTANTLLSMTCVRDPIKNQVSVFFKILLLFAHAKSEL